MMRHRRRGLQFVELTAGLFVIVIIVLAFMDMSTLLTAGALNCSLARDAARAASTGPPGALAVGANRKVDASEPPYQRAAAAILKSKPNSDSFELASEIQVVETVENPIPSQPYGGPVSGNVSVATTILVHPRFILPVVHVGTIPLTASETFPYTWVMKSSLVPVSEKDSGNNQNNNQDSNYSSGSYGTGSYTSGSYSSGSNTPR
ncbi:MAG: hypothetical protein C5B53_06900 [Candidatus Melainabacteria bacterium]|nr:MAG: hypothetical protein C5B53_06900 [Candidatus Melainabacteria bacterium]